MNDLISRRSAIQAIDDLPNCYNGYSDTYDKAYIIGTIEELPSAEQRRGKWIYKTQNVKGGKGQTYGKWQCSCCKKKEPRRRDYCPNCGAKMERSEE